MYRARTQPRGTVEQHAIGGTNYVVFLTLDEGSIKKHWVGTQHFVMVGSKCEYFFFFFLNKTYVSATTIERLKPSNTYTS